MGILTAPQCKCIMFEPLLFDRSPFSLPATVWLAALCALGPKLAPSKAKHLGLSLFELDSSFSGWFNRTPKGNHRVWGIVKGNRLFSGAPPIPILRQTRLWSCSALRVDWMGRLSCEFIFLPVVSKVDVGEALAKRPPLSVLGHSREGPRIKPQTSSRHSQCFESCRCVLQAAPQKCWFQASLRSSTKTKSPNGYPPNRHTRVIAVIASVLSSPGANMAARSFLERPDWGR